MPRERISEIDFVDAVVPRNRAWAIVQDLQRSLKHTHASRPLVVFAAYYYLKVLTLTYSISHSCGRTKVVFGTIYKDSKPRHPMYKPETHYFRSSSFTAVATVFNGRRTGMAVLCNHEHGSLATGVWSFTRLKKSCNKC